MKLNYEAWASMSAEGATDMAVLEAPTMPVIPTAGRKQAVQRRAVFVIESVEKPELKALYGGGTPPPEFLNQYFFTKESGLPQATVGGPRSILRSLEQLNIKPEEIKVVILDHLHFAWSYNPDLFPDAQVIIEKGEIAAALDPDPPCRFGYQRAHLEKVLSRRQPDKLLVVDGDYEVWPGFDILFTPGHTPGECCAVIQTVKGKACIGGEVGGATCYRYLFPDDPRYFPGDIFPDAYRFLKGSQVFPSHSCGNVVDNIESVRRMFASSDIVVPMFELFAPMAIPYQWWQHPSEQYVNEVEKKLKTRKPADGLSPECLPFLEERQRRLGGKAR